MLKTGLSIFFFVFVAPTSFVSAHVSSISAATARAGRAAVEAYDVPYLNPAAIAYVDGYSFMTGASRRSSPAGGEEEYSLLLADNSIDTVVPAAVAYTFKKDLALSAFPWSQKEIRLALGHLIGDRSSLGIGFVYREEEQGQLPTRQMNLVVGSLFGVTRDLGFAVVLENIAPMISTGQPRETLSPRAAFGVSYNHGQFLRLRADISSAAKMDLSRPILAMGLENYWNRWMIFRIGAAHDEERRENLLTTGLGFAGPRFGIHYAFQRVEGEQSEDSRHSIDLGFPLW